MNAALRYVLVAVLLGGMAGLLLAASRMDRRLAAAQRQMATFDLQAPESTYRELADYLDAAGIAPWLFAETRAGLEVRRAALRYWRGEYAGLLAEHGDPSSAEAAGNPALQYIVANATVRAALDPEADTEQVLRALDGAIDVYLGVLQESPGHLDAAYNYEYLLRLRADLASGAELPGGRQRQHGREGEAPEDAEMEEIKIYVPVQRDVDPEIDESPTLGAGERIRKRG